MALSQTSDLGKTYSMLMLKSFLIWVFTLTVCLLVVGFPFVVLMATVGCLLSIILQSVMPVSAVLFVAGSIFFLNIATVMIAAGVLTAKGINPAEVEWLSWLHGKAEEAQTAVYAACPLTCEMK